MQKHPVRQLVGYGLPLLLLLAGCSSSGSSPAATSSAPLPPSAQANAATGTAGTAGSATVPTGEVATVQPNSQGQALFDAIDSATTSIDIVVYQYNDATLQQKLVAAMQRGVKVRLILDGYNASNVKYNSAAAKALEQAATAAGVPAGMVRANWSSDNFNITHQKTVIIDAADGGGAPLPAASLPASARVLVSTGNFQSFKTQPFFSARDFYVTASDQNLINQVETVYSSDFSCAVPTVTNDLKTSADLVWSNGTTGLYANEVGQYPPVSEGYFGDQKVTDPAPVDQGNSYDYQAALINKSGPGDVVRIYNEEFTSTGMVQAVTAALQRGAEVRIVMTYAQPSSSGKPSTSMANLTTLAGQGAKVTLYAPQSVVPEALYIHAKSITVNGADGTFKQGFVGSENFSDPSLLFNRELGLPLDAADPGDASVAQTIVTTFDGDFSSTQNTATPTTIPAAWNQAAAALGAEQSSSADPAGEPSSRPAPSGPAERLGSPVGKCGPIT